MGWNNESCGKGHIHQVFKQEKQESCGPACIAMAMQRIFNKKITEKDIRQASQKSDFHYRPAATDVPGVRGNPLQEALMNEFKSVKNIFSYTGTGANNLAATLRTLGVKNASYRDVGRSYVRNLFKQVQASRPAIGLIHWSGGGGHFVLIDRVIRRLGRETLFCICDPILGARCVSLKPKDAPSYENGRATFSGHIVTT